MNRDYAYEALAEATATDMVGGRGELNRALKLIRDQAGLEGDALAQAIRVQALLYRQVMGPDVLLTPTALAKHWQRIGVEAERNPHQTNRSASVTQCETCDGDRMVLVVTRPAKETQWMQERGLKASGGMEEYAPCPECNSGADVRYSRFDGSVFHGMDPATVRDRISR